MSTNPNPDSFPAVSRRAWLQRSGAGLLGAAAIEVSGRGTLLAAAEPKKGTPSTAAAALAPLNRFPRMVQEDYVRRIRAAEAAGEARRSALKTRADAEAYVRDVRAKIALCFGAMPEKTPLNARVTRVVERQGYRIEHVIFESRPGLPVTANLYVPTGRSGKLPGVVGACGHSDTGKAGDTYQSFAQGLVRQGYVTLIFDPIGQGERLQHVGPNLKPRHGVGTAEHAFEGNRLALTGEFIGSWFVWDGIRALDYLLTRPEVDPQHVGLTGNSGGGTQAAWLCALEPRFTMAAPGCFITTWRRNIENEEVADPEQCPPRVLAAGVDYADFIAAFAPKPVILLGQEKDFFDARGLEEAFARVQRIYRLLGAEQNAQLFIGPDPHGYWQPNREAMYGWFNRQTKIASGQSEPPLALEKPEVLWCTPKGQVAADAEPATTFGFVAAQARALEAKRGPVAGEALRTAVARALKLPARSGVPDYRILRPSSGRSYPKRFAATYAVETEPEVHALVTRLSETALTSRPPRGAKRAVLYLAHNSADAELRSEPLLKELLAAEPDVPLFACDVRGIGESNPIVSNRDPLSYYGASYFHAALGIMFDYPTAGQRTHDVLRVLDWLGAQGHDEIHLVGRGFGAFPATFAAVLHPAVKQVTLKHALTSYRAVAEATDYNWPLAVLVPEVLRHFDLPDCYRDLDARGLRQVDPVGAAGVPA